MLKNWCFWTVLEKTLESHLDCKEIQPVHSKWNQSWVFIGRTVTEAPILWPSDVKNGLIGKDPDAGKAWRQEKDDTGWDGWMASPTWWIWVWASSGSWWWTGKFGHVLQSMGLQSWTRLSDWTESFVAFLSFGFPLVLSRGHSKLRCVDFSVQWLLLLQSTGSRHVGFSGYGSQAQ